MSVALVVAAAFIHATWNLMAKRAADAGPIFLITYNAVACVSYLPWIIWQSATGRIGWSPAILACLAASGIIHLVYSLSLQRGYQAADFSVVYPVARGSAPLLSSLGAILWLGEAPTLLRLAGLAAVVAGIGLITTQGNLSAFHNARARAGMRWGLATGLLIAGYTLVDAYGVKRLDIDPVFLDWCNSFVRFCLLLPVAVARRADIAPVMAGRWGLAVWVGLLSPLSYILVLIALGQGADVGLIAPAREMSMMLAALMGMVILKEAVGPWRLAGCAVLVGGVLMLGAS